MKPEWMRLRDAGQSPGWLAGRWLNRKVLEVVNVHANLKAGNWQKADEGVPPDETGTGRRRVCVMPRSRPAGRRRGLHFQSASILVQLPSFLPTLGEDLRLSLGARGPCLIWALPPSCTDPSSFQTQGLGSVFFPPFLKLQFTEYLLCARRCTKCSVSISASQTV